VWSVRTTLPRDGSGIASPPRRSQDEDGGRWSRPIVTSRVGCPLISSPALKKGPSQRERPELFAPCTVCTSAHVPISLFPEGKKAKITPGSLPLDRRILVGAETSWTSTLNRREVPHSHPCITINQERTLPPPSLSFSFLFFNRDHYSSLTVSVLAFFIPPNRSLPRRPPAL
jgi:hypothetical protein